MAVTVVGYATTEEISQGPGRQRRPGDRVGLCGRPPGLEAQGRGDHRLAGGVPVADRGFGTRRPSRRGWCGRDVGRASCARSSRCAGRGCPCAHPCPSRYGAVDVLGSRDLGVPLRCVCGESTASYRKYHSLLEAVRNALDEKLVALRVKYRRVGSGVAGTYVRHRLADEGRHLRQCEDELVRLADGDRGGLGRAVSILRVALRSVHPSRYQTQLRDLLDALQVNRHSGGR